MAKEKKEFEKESLVYHLGEKGKVVIPGNYVTMVEFKDGTRSVKTSELEAIIAEPQKKEAPATADEDILRELRRDAEEPVLTSEEIRKIIDEPDDSPHTGRTYEPARPAPERRQEAMPARRWVIGRGLARAVELLSLTPAIIFAGIGFTKRNNYHRIDFPTATTQQFDEHKRALNILDGALAAVNSDLQNLWSAYKRHYHQSRTETYVTIDSDGNPTTHTRTEYYWDVPRGLPQENIIESWRDSSQGLAKKINEVKSQPIFSFEKESAKIKKEKANAFLEGLITAAVYGIPAAALLGYEEAFEFLSNSHGSGTYLAEEGFTRRNFLKMGAALAGAVPVAYFMNEHAKESEKGMEKAKTQLERIVSSVKNLPDNAVVSQAIGTGPDALIQQMKNYQAQAQASLCIGIRQADVMNSFSSLLTNAKASEVQLERMFADGVPESISKPMRNAYGIKMVNEFNSSSKGKIYLDKLIEGGVFAGVLALIMGSYETYKWSQR